MEKKNFFDLRTLWIQIPLLFILILILFIIILAVANFYLSFIIRKQAENDNLIHTRSVSISINEDIKDAQDELDKISLLPGIQKMEPLQDREFLQKISQIESLFSEIAVFNQKKEITFTEPSDSSIVSRFSSHKEIFLPTFQSGESSLTGLNASGDSSIFVSVPVISGNNEVIGVVSGRISSHSTLGKFIQNFRIGKDGGVFLVYDGKVIFSSSNLKKYSNKPTLIDSKFVGALMKGKEGISEYEVGDVSHVVTYHALPQNKWGVIVQQPSSEIFAPLSYFARLSLIIAIVMGIIITGLSLYYRRIILQPIRNLLEGLKRVSNGDLDYQIITSIRNELGQLTEFFNRISQKLTTLYRVARTMNILAGTEEAIDQICSYIIDSIVAMPRVTACSVLLKNRKGDFEIVECRGLIFREGERAGSKNLISDGDLIDILGERQYRRLAKQGRYISFNIQDNPKIPQWLIEDKTKYIYIFPLREKNRLIGLLHINSFETSPFDREDVGLIYTLALQIGSAFERLELFRDIQESYIQTVQALAEAVDAKDVHTSEHSKAVSSIAVAIAKELGLSKEEVEQIREASLIHDIGKIGVSDQILLKPDKLTNEEFEEIKKHPGIGAKIVAPVSLPEEVKMIAFAHHERLDGKGYPQGLASKEIPLGSRILFVADAYNAMVTDRVYRKALTKKQAIEELKRHSGSQFDPKVVDAFLTLLDKRLI